MTLSKRVLFITPGLWKGGAETQLIKIARSLRAQQKEVKIISLKPINGFNDDFAKEGIDVVFLKKWSKSPILNIMLLNKHIKDFKADVVVAFMFIAIVFARLLKIRYGFNLISSIRTSVLPQKWFVLFKATSAWDNCIVYNSHASKENFEQKKLVKKPGLVIHNGISIPSLKALNNSEVAASPFVWICIAHFKWNKDYLTLFKAIALIKERNFRVDIVGNLHNETWPLKVIEELKIQNRVRLLGFKTNASEYLLGANALVLSSFLEGMPNAVLEAMAYKKPIVATDIDGNNELLTNANCGFLSRKQDPQDLADKMVRMMEITDEERSELALNGRSYIESNFSEEKVMSEWSSVINSYSKVVAI